MKRYLLDRKVESDRNLAEIAGKVTGWRDVLPYLMENDTEKVEETIVENYPTIERRRLVTSTVLEPIAWNYFESDCGFKTVIVSRARPLPLSSPCGSGLAR